MGSLQTRQSERTVHEVFPGARGSFVHGNSITVASWVLDAGATIPEHDHPHEQVINCLAGEFSMTVDGNTYELGAGDVLVIPGGVTHSGRAVTEVRCIDVFTPVREDYRI